MHKLVTATSRGDLRSHCRCYSLSRLLPLAEGEEEVQNVSPPIDLRTSIISQIMQCSSLNAVKAAHASMLRFHLHLDLFLWNHMIRAFADTAQFRSALSLYPCLGHYGLQPDHFTFPVLLKACASISEFFFGRQLHAHLLLLGHITDVFVGNSLISIYAKWGRFELSRLLFDSMPLKNVVSWSSTIGAYAQNGCFPQGLSLFSKMLECGVVPNRSAVLNAIACVETECTANSICTVVLDNGFDMDRSVQSAAMGMYARCGRIDVARSLFDCILDKDLVSWTSMIEAYAQADLPLKALELYKQMISEGFSPDSVTLLSVIQACSNLASSLQARMVHGYIIRCFLKNHIALESAVVDLYVKCGSLEYARKVFDRVREKNLILWSTMISGYGMHGYGREALHLFDKMKGSVKPDDITFVSVLSACSHVGLVAEGWECFNSMNKNFGVIPKSEHYACMVDLLGRAGQLNEARHFIEKMPITPDAGVWGALLGACRIHMNVELAELAVKSLFNLDADNPGRYVLLYNIYASSGRRKEADLIRALMKHKGVKKAAGHTIIEIKNKLYTFVAGDQSNPQADLIHLELRKLMERIRQEGYVPDLNFVLHDVEEEVKEELKCYSS